MPIERRVTIAMDHRYEVAVAAQAWRHVEIDDARVGCNDWRSPRCGDVDARVDPVRIRAARFVLLKPIAVATEPLAYAPVPTRGNRPLELARPATGRGGGRLVLQLQSCHLGVNRRPLCLDLLVLH